MLSQQLPQIAQKTRRLIIQMIHQAGSGHPASALGLADLFTVLYFAILKQHPQQPNWPERDYFILSNGHVCPVLYATLAQAGYFPESELLTLRQINSRLQGHPHYGSLPGVENNSGSLGQGLSQACGLAWALKHDQKSNRVFCLTSDAEHQEGQVWEAYLFANKYHLDNLIVIIDRNNIQIDADLDEVMPIEPLKQKLLAFGLRVLEMNGHNFQQMITVLSRIAGRAANPETELSITTSTHFKHKPTVVICQTIPGKGVSFMAGKAEWHGKAPNDEEANRALKELG